MENLHSLISVILVPIDGSSCAMRALSYACDLGKNLHAEIEVCYAIDYLSLPGSLSKSPESAPDLLVEDGERMLLKARAVARKHDVSLRSRLVRGNTAEAIMRLAKEVNADLIVMGTHGRTGFRRLVLGSVAESVARRSTIPVLLVRDETE